MMNLKIYHNGQDISDKVEFSSLFLYDRYGGILDSLSIEFPEEKYDFEFSKYDEISITADGYKTGTMYIDDLFFYQDRYSISAVPYKAANKICESGIWKNIQLEKIAKDIADKNGLTLKMYGVEKVTYLSLTRNNEVDLQFLSRICKREGYSVKIYDGNLIIFNEKHIENDYKELTLQPTDIDPNPSFKIATNGMQNVTVQYFNIETGELIKYTATDEKSRGGTITITEHLKDIAEAQRFSYGYLRDFNKNELTGLLTMDLNLNISACTVLNLQNFSEFSGKFVVYEVSHNILREKTTLKIRRTLEY